MLLTVEQTPLPNSSAWYSAINWVPKVIKSERFTALALTIIVTTGAILALTITGGGLIVTLLIPAAVIVCSSIVIGSRILIFRDTSRGKGPSIPEAIETTMYTETDLVIPEAIESLAPFILEAIEPSIQEAVETAMYTETQLVIHEANDDEDEVEQGNNHEEVEQGLYQPVREILLWDLVKHTSRASELRQCIALFDRMEDKAVLIDRLCRGELCNLGEERVLTSPLQEEERGLLIQFFTLDEGDSLSIRQAFPRVESYPVREQRPCLSFSEAKMDDFISRLLQDGPIDLVLQRVETYDDLLEYEREGILNRPLLFKERARVIKRLRQFKNEGDNIDLSPGINLAHLLHSHTVQGAATFIPKGCELDKILVRSIIDLFEAMNTTLKGDEHSHVRSDYIDRESFQVVSDAGKAISYDQAKTNISTLVDHIEQRSQFRGVPTNDRMKKKFYTQLETFLKVIIYEIQSGNHDASLCNDIILQLVTAVENCAARYMSVFSEGHGRLTLRTETNSFEDIVLEEFHTIRNTIVMDITNNHTRGRGPDQPHVLNRHMRNLGVLRGIRNSENLDFADAYDVEITELQSVRAFDRIYTAQHIQQCFDEMVNGVQVMKENGSPFNPPRYASGDLVIGKPMAIGWLGEHVPPDWNPSIRDVTGSIIPLTNEQIEALFGPGFDDEQKELARKNSEYQQIIGAGRSREIRALMFRIACTTTVGDGNIKSVACSYILQQLGVLNNDINWRDLHMDVDVLSNIFSCENDDLSNAGIKF